MEKKDVFLNTLGKAEKALEKMEEAALVIRWLYETGDYPDAYGQSLKLEEQAEKLVLLTRTLPAYTGAALAFEAVEQILTKNIPVEAGFTAEDWFLVRIPALLPKKAGGSADYVRSFLYPAMKNFFAEKEPVRYRDCVLIYRHVYDRRRPERRMRDHDNIEVNMVSDIIALYVMPDDDPGTCAHYYCSAAGNTERTEVYVVPKKDFPIWLVLEKMIPEEGVKLYEERLKKDEKDM